MVSPVMKGFSRIVFLMFYFILSLKLYLQKTKNYFRRRISKLPLISQKNSLSLMCEMFYIFVIKNVQFMSNLKIRKLFFFLFLFFKSSFMSRFIQNLAIGSIRLRKTFSDSFLVIIGYIKLLILEKFYRKNISIDVSCVFVFFNFLISASYCS